MSTPRPWRRVAAPGTPSGRDVIEWVSPGAIRALTLMPPTAAAPVVGRMGASWMSPRQGRDPAALDTDATSARNGRRVGQGPWSPTAGSDGTPLHSRVRFVVANHRLDLGPALQIQEHCYGETVAAHEHRLSARQLRGRGGG